MAHRRRLTTTTTTTLSSLLAATPRSLCPPSASSASPSPPSSSRPPSVSTTRFRRRPTGAAGGAEASAAFSAAGRGGGGGGGIGPPPPPTRGTTTAISPSVSSEKRRSLSTTRFARVRDLRTTSSPPSPFSSSTAVVVAPDVVGGDGGVPSVVGRPGRAAPRSSFSSSSLPPPALSSAAVETPTPSDETAASSSEDDGSGGGKGAAAGTTTNETTTNETMTRTVVVVETPTGERLDDDLAAALDVGSDEDLVRIRDVDRLRDLVTEIERRPSSSLTLDDVTKVVHPLMISTSRLKTVEGAELTERLLARCIQAVSDREEEASALGVDDDDDRGEDDGGGRTEAGEEEAREAWPYPNEGMYNLSMSAWSAVPRPSRTTALRTESILTLMTEERDRDEERVRSYNASLPSGSLGVGGRRRRKARSARPDVVNYATVLNGWAKSGSKEEGPRRATEILEDMERESGLVQRLERRERGFLGGDDDDEADAAREEDDATTNVRLASLIVDDIDDDDVAEGETKHRRFQPHLAPDLVCYNTVLAAWSRSGHPSSASEIRSLLKHMERLSDAFDAPERFGPNVTSFNWLIHAYAKLGSVGRGRGGMDSGDAANEAERVLREMHRRYVAFAMDCGDVAEECPTKPNVKSYNAYLKALSSVDPVKAERFLESLLVGNRDDDALGPSSSSELPPIARDVRPDVVSFNTVINGHAKSSSPGAGARAERILDALLDRPPPSSEDTDGGDAHDDGFVRPDVVTCNSVMNAHSKSSSMGVSDAAERCERILRRMLAGWEGKEYRNFDEEADSVDEEGRATIDVKPNAVSFSTAIHAWACSPRSDGAERAEALLDRMERLFEETTGDASFEPNAACYGGVIAAWSKRSGKPADGAVEGAAERAEGVLTRMEERGGNVAPTTRLCNAVLEAWSRDESTSSPPPAAADGPSERRTTSSRVSRAKALLERMLLSTQTDADPRESRASSAPNTESYNRVIDACASSSFRTADERREAFFAAIETYNRLCDAAAASASSFDVDERDSSTSSASDVDGTRRRRRRSRVGPNDLTYRSMFRVVGSLLPRRRNDGGGGGGGGRERTEVCGKLWTECIEDGMLSDDAYDAVREVVPEVDLAAWIERGTGGSAASVFGDGDGLRRGSGRIPDGVEFLRDEWSRNVPAAGRSGRRGGSGRRRRRRPGPS